MITTKLKPSSLQLDDRTELMVYRLRHADGGIDPRSSGTWGHSDGQAEHLPWEMFEVVAQGQWTSPLTGITSPQRWGVRVPAAGLQLRITPTFADQEPDTHSSTRVVYWEGSAGGRPVPGVGYVALVGYQAKPDG